MSFAGTFGAYAAWMAFLVHYMRLPAHSPRLALIGKAITLVAVVLAIVAVPVVLTDVTWLRAISSQFGIFVLVTGVGLVLMSARAEPARAWAYAACWAPSLIATLARLWLDAAPGQGGILSVYGVYVAAVYSMLSFAIILSVDIQDREMRLRRIAERNEARFQGFARAASDGFFELDDGNRLILATGPKVDWRLDERPDWIEALTRAASRKDDPALTNLRRAIDAREPFRAVELAVTPPPGQGSLTLELSGEPFDGGYRGILADVTDRRVRQEREVRQGRMAAIGQLSSGLAHEINNLLHPIINLARRVRDRLDADPEGRAYLQVVLESGHRASDILSSVLKSVHPSTTTVVQLPFATAVRDVAGEIGGLLPGRVRLSVAVDAEGGPLISSTEAFQVLSNLITNAVDALGGQGDIRLSVFRLETDGAPILRLTVADTGSGMTPEAIARATEPFFTTKPQGTGTGLGLAMVSQIVQGWHGQLRFESAPGEGTRVIIDVPDADGQIQPGARAVARELQGARP
jgi:signal transduction histidine kinase